MITPQENYDELAKDALFDALREILGLTAARAEKMISFSWPSEDGSVRFTATPSTDVCYIRFTPYSLPNEGFINHSVEDGVERMDTHIGLRAQFIFYGPHSLEYATRTRVGINRTDVRSLFKTASMAPIPNNQMPVSLDELIDGRWYKRTDISVDFYQLIVYTGEVSVMEEPPEIEIMTDETDD